jgi:hypothetical protein
MLVNIYVELLLASQAIGSYVSVETKAGNVPEVGFWSARHAAHRAPAVTAVCWGWANNPGSEDVSRSLLN